jgi:transcriptional regulator GlxA family with amidase domain
MRLCRSRRTFTTWWCWRCRRPSPFDLAVPAQVFGHRDKSTHYRLTVCAPEPGPVRTTTGFSIQVDGLSALTTADTVVVPGYRPTVTPDQLVLDALRDAADRGARMVSICIGAFALAAAGLLDGRRATTHWRDAAELARRYPLVQVDPDVLYVDEGQLLTSAGVAAGIDLCLHLVRRDRGSAQAARIARRMVVAPRTLARRWIDETGLTPLRWLTEQRLLEVQRLLETSSLTIDAIARHTGIGSAAHLRTLFARKRLISPAAYRSAHRPGR